MGRTGQAGGGEHVTDVLVGAVGHNLAGDGGVQAGVLHVGTHVGVVEVDLVATAQVAHTCRAFPGDRGNISLGAPPSPASWPIDSIEAWLLPIRGPSQAVAPPSLLCPPRRPLLGLPSSCPFQIC